MSADLVIKGGMLVDGTGGPARQADVAVQGDRIVAVGTDVGPARRQLDARGLHVTPGFVDIHTHYDAQATWDPLLTPSGWHGVTTLVMGNCGVGFAPAQPERRDWLVGLMEGVEDIPGIAMTEGMKWDWESFPQYLDSLERFGRALDIGAQVPHGPLRTYVMGERGARHQKATDEDLARMAALLEEGLAAGALGFSTSRTLLHKGMDGEVVPGTHAEEPELMALGGAMQRAGHGVFQMTANHTDMPQEFAWMEAVARKLGVTVSFNLQQTDASPGLWQEMVAKLEAAAREGLPIHAQVAGRPTGILMGFESTIHPFLFSASYMQLHALPIEERLAELRKPEVRARVVAEVPFDVGDFGNMIINSLHKMYALRSEADYEPDPKDSAEAVAARSGVTPREVVYDWMMEQGGHALVYFPIFNFSNGNLDHLHGLHQHPRTVLGLSDGGAHCGAICDASMPTYMLTWWGRDRPRGTLPLEHLVRRQTRDTAALYGLRDRGVVAPGMLADLNVLDLAGLGMEKARMVHDLPAGGRRLVQKAHGYRFTVKSGAVIMENAEHTGALPGRLLRGPQAVPTV